MPLLPSAKKALRQTKRKTAVNQRVRSRLKTFIDRAFSDNNLNTLSDAYSAVDRAVKRNLLHKNKAARLKSNLSKALVSAAKVVDPSVAKPTAKKAVAKKSSAKKTSKKSTKKVASKK